MSSAPALSWRSARRGGPGATHPEMNSSLYISGAHNRFCNSRWRRRQPHQAGPGRSPSRATRWCWPTRGICSARARFVRLGTQVKSTTSVVSEIEPPRSKAARVHRTIRAIWTTSEPHQARVRGEFFRFDLMTPMLTQARSTCRHRSSGRRERWNCRMAGGWQTVSTATDSTPRRR
jgi:hypothetical protein